MVAPNSVLAGKQAADKESIVGWGIFGLLLAIVAVPMAYLRSPILKSDILAEQSDDIDPAAFEMAYINQLKGRQTKAAWIGCICAFVVWGLLWSCAMVGLIGTIGTGADVSGVPEISVTPTAKKSTWDKIVDSGRIVTSDEYAKIKEGMS